MKHARTKHILQRTLQAGGMILLLASLLHPGTVLAHPPGITERVSVSSAGEEGNDTSGFLSPPSISADGRFVAFDSAATNLIEGGNLSTNIFVHDRQTGVTEIVSVSSRGRQGEGLSSFPDLSADGRFVAFDSDAENLARDRNGTTDIFRHDRQTGETILVSVTSDEQQGSASSHAPAISADGNFIVFHANSALVPEDTNNNTDVYIRDVQAGTTALVSVALDGTAGNNTSFIQDISADGRFVVFVSDATNLVPNDVVDNEPNVYVRDLSSGVTELVSVGSDGTRADVGFFDIPSISADGRYVAFSTFDSLVPEDTSGFTLDIYLRDRVAGTTELISVNSDEVPGDGRSEAPSVSADGRYVAFQSDSTNFAPEGSIFPDEDIFVRDRVAGITVRVSESSAGEEGNARSIGNDISGDGLVIAFGSEASNLVPNDTNFAKDIFVHDERPAADLAVTKTDSPDPVRKGGTITYTIVVTNQGPASAAAMQLTDVLSTGVRFVSVTPTAGTCSEADGTVTCTLGDIASGGSVTVTINVSARQTGTAINTVQVSSSSPDPDGANNTATVETVITK
ncbi:MAG TPA: hypothetical protein VFG81_02965 [Anaerolineales bacterium]|jgi:uncharacterized repeat protein (TIGR01451 family)|nr:hypothetical protein [Anaerolineales bacterium]